MVSSYDRYGLDEYRKCCEGNEDDPEGFFRKYDEMSISSQRERCWDYKAIYTLIELFVTNKVAGASIGQPGLIGHVNIHNLPSFIHQAPEPVALGIASYMAADVIVRVCYDKGLTERAYIRLKNKFGSRISKYL